MTLISVVVPVHNAEVYLARTLEQLKAVAQATEHRVEFVIIDDHSTDRSVEKLQRWGDELSGVRLLTAAGTGVARARNQAVAECRGDFVWFTDADDTWSPLIVQKMAEIAIGSACDLVVSNARKIFPDGSTNQIRDASQRESIGAPELLERVLDGRIQGHLWNKLFARDLLGTDPFPITRAHSDLAGVLTIAPRLSRIELIPDELYTYELRSGSILNSSAYRWQDLHHCLRLAEAASVMLPRTRRSALLSFKYRNVVVPVANELIRRAHPPAQLSRDDGFAQNREAIEWRDVGALLVARQVGLSARAALLKLLPRMYTSMYQTKLKHGGGVVAVDRTAHAREPTPTA